MLYVAIDGDNIGSTVERYVILEDANALSRYASSVDLDIAELGNKLAKLGAHIIFCGGDSILAEFSLDTSIVTIKQILSHKQSIGISVGVGTSMREAYIALKMAKTSGKGCLVTFDRLEEHETLQSRAQAHD